MNCVKEKLSYKKPVLTLTDTIKVECKADAPEKGTEILTTLPFVSPLETVSLDGQLTYKGKLILTVVYMTDNGVKNVECATEFSSSIKDEKITPFTHVRTKTTVLKTELPDFTGNISASITIKCDFELFEQGEISYVCGGDGIVLKKDVVNAFYLEDVKTSDVYVDEDFTLNYPVKNMLLHNESIYPVGVNAGVDCIIIDGEAVISTYLLQKEENNDIIKEVRTLPFKVEVPFDGIMPKKACHTCLQLKSARYDVVVEEETNKTTVNVGLDLSVTAYLFNEQTCQLPLDAFSVEKELAIKNCERCLDKFSNNKALTLKFNERVALSPEPEAGARILFTLPEEFNITDYTFSNDVLTIDAVIFAKTVIKDFDGIIKTIPYKFLVELSQKIDNVDKNETILSVDGFLTDINSRLVTLSEAECYGNIKVFVKFKSNNTICYVEDIAETGVKQQKTNAISVYIALKGENLWDLAKRLNIPPDDVIKLNPELEFPLSGDERIIIYRQMNKEY